MRLVDAALSVGALAISALLGLGCSSSKTEAPAAEHPLAVPPLDAGPSAQSEAGARPNDPLASRESQHVARTLADVAKLRGIRPTKAVPGVKLPRPELVGKIKDKALREYPADVLRREGQLIQLMGFAPASFDYLGEMMHLLEAQLEGFYEPKNGTMYLAADLSGKEAEATLAHELVHALQDQKWDLRERSVYRPGKSDESMALAALAEGDATSLMMDFILRENGQSALDLPQEALRAVMTSGVNMGEAQNAPRILRSTLIAPYMEGLSFVHALRKKGGFAAVDQAWDRVPTTTEQVLHVDKWLANEPAIAVPAPSGNALGAGFQRVDEDTAGELGAALTYEEWMPASEARLAAAGWGGDRSAMFARGDEIAFAVHTRYDAGTPKPDAFAERAIGKLASGLKKTIGGANKPAIADPATICFERKELGPLLFAQRGRELVMLVGPAKTTGGAWTSAGTCALAKKWADEVLAQR